MNLTIEQLQRRLQLLQIDKERAWAGVQQIVGAIEDCQYWLNVLQAPDEPAAEGPRLAKDVNDEPADQA